MASPVSEPRDLETRKLIELVRHRTAGYTIVREGSEVYAVKGSRRILLLSLDSPAALRVWETYQQLGDVRALTLANLASAIEQGLLVPQISPRPKKEVAEASLELAKRSLEKAGVACSKVLLIQLAEMGVDKSIALAALADVLAELSQLDGVKVVSKGNFWIVARRDALGAPWKHAASGPVYTTSFCFNRRYNPKGYRYVPIRPVPVRVRIDRSMKGMIYGRVEAPDTMRGFVAFFVWSVRVLPNVGETVYSYMYDVRNTYWGDRVVYLFGWSRTEEEAKAEAETVMAKQLKAGHFTFPGLYGVDRWFKVYRIRHLMTFPGYVYAVEARGARARIDASKAEVRKLESLGPLRKSFTRQLRGRRHESLEHLAYLAAAADFNYLGSYPLEDTWSIYIVQDLVKQFRPGALVYYYVTVLGDKWYLAVTRLMNYSSPAITELTRLFRRVSAEDYALLRVYRFKTFSFKRRGCSDVIRVNIAVRVRPEAFGETVRELNALNREERSRRRAEGEEES